MSAEFPKPSELSTSAPSGPNNDVWNDEQREVHRQRLGNQDDLNSPDVASLPNGSGSPKQAILKKVGILAVLGTWVFFNFYKFDYVVILPGGTDVVNERITIKATAANTSGAPSIPAGVAPKTYPAQGKLMWATVGVKNDVRGLDLLMGWLKGDSDVFKRELLYGKANPKEAAQQSRDEMDDAKSVSKVLAARRLGIATFEGGAEVLDREKGRPVEKLLANGELIVAADGKAICLSGDLRELMLTKKRGDTVSLTVQSVPKPGTTPTAGTAKTGAAGVTGTPAPKPVERTVVVPLHEVKGIKRQLMGVILGPSKTRPCRLPFELDVNTDRIGGPSAGLAMTLAVLDRLSPGELTGGGKVAATGTIEADGSVGQVGGVKQKTASVRASGAKLFLVPIEEVALAKPHAGKMQVVGVRNLDEALAALRKVGGDPLPSPSR
jgi:Lon-like protease